MSDRFPERIETERLVLERLCRENAGVLEFYRHASRHEPGIDEVTRHLSWDTHATPKETWDFFEYVGKQWEDAAAATYAIRPAAGEDGAGEFAGNCGLTIDWERRTGTLGLWLRESFWGRGYSGERAAALMELAFETLDLELVAVTHQTGNEKSRRAIEKYVEAHGGGFDALIRNAVPGDDRPIDQRRYTVTREQYFGR